MREPKPKAKKKKRNGSRKRPKRERIEDEFDELDPWSEENEEDRRHDDELAQIIRDVCG